MDPPWPGSEETRGGATPPILLSFTICRGDGSRSACGSRLPSALRSVIRTRGPVVAGRQRYGRLTLTFSNPQNGKSVTTHNESQVIRITYNEDGSFDTAYRTGVIFAFTAPGVGEIITYTGDLNRTTKRRG
jgi:hypothetical protein